MTVFRNAAFLIVLLVALPGTAQALSYRDIAGLWCGTSTDYEFTPDMLIVTFHDGSPTKRFEVTGYDYAGNTVTMHWISDGEKLYTEFSEFSSDGQNMAQVSNDVGPRRPFHRC